MAIVTYVLQLRDVMAMPATRAGHSATLLPTFASTLRGGRSIALQDQYCVAVRVCDGSCSHSWW